MSRRYFGTDGIRGPANIGPLTPEMVMRIGQAVGTRFLRGQHKHRVLIGKDTRLSGYMMEQALTAGFTSVGMDVVQVGPMPTPAVAMLTRSMRADLGVMISASHNPFHDNGIKFFGPDGYKLSDADEAEIESLIEAGSTLAGPGAIGRARRIDDARGRYVHHAKLTFPEALRLDRLRVVVDCANGAAYRVAPEALWELGAEVVEIAVSPDGFNINANCGSTHPAMLQAAVRERRADIGIALDGDADRLIIVDETGTVVDGDQIMAVIAEAWHNAGRLRGGGIAATVMSNMGLERHLSSLGLVLHRAAVGDRYVLEAMREHGLNLGGEQSGHLILADYGTTGDGLVAALQVLAVLAARGEPASQVLNRFRPVPQLLKNVRYTRGKPLEDARVKEAISGAEARLEGQGRLLIRKSGTEPLIRVMAEGDDPALVETCVDAICDAVRAAA